MNPFLVHIILSETRSWEKLLESPSHTLWLIHGEMEAQGASMDGCPRPPGNLEANFQFFRTIQIRPSDLLSTFYSFTQQTAWERPATPPVIDCGSNTNKTPHLLHRGDKDFRRKGKWRSHDWKPLFSVRGQ